MEMTIIGTHNPQDFFEGAEPSDLTESRVVTREDKTAWDYICDLSDGGYQVMVLRKENE